MSHQIIDKDRPSTWIKFQGGLCIGCHSNCCTLPVEVTLTDLIRMNLVDSEIDLIEAKKVAKLLIKTGIIKCFRARTGLFTLTQKSDGSCYYLTSDRLCSIYANRPDVCRQFPQIGPRSGFCPANRKALKVES